MNNHRHFLQEFSKFASGLIAADFLFGVWLYASSSLPLTFWGTTWSSSTVMAWMIFDVILFLILIHYAWHAEVHAPSIKQRNLFLVIGYIIGIIALAHLLRLIFGISIDIGGWQAPFWLSWVAVIVAAYISYSSFVFAGRVKK
jgi:hypothetical protein